MRFMTLYKPGTENDMPTDKEMAAVGQLIEEMAKAGVLIATDGLQPSSRGARPPIAGDKLTVTDRPFTETKELMHDPAAFPESPSELQSSADRRARTAAKA